MALAGSPELLSLERGPHQPLPVVVNPSHARKARSAAIELYVAPGNGGKTRLGANGDSVRLGNGESDLGENGDDRGFDLKGLTRKT